MVHACSLVRPGFPEIPPPPAPIRPSGPPGPPGAGGLAFALVALLLAAAPDAPAAGRDSPWSGLLEARMGWHSNPLLVPEGAASHEPSSLVGGRARLRGKGGVSDRLAWRARLEAASSYYPAAGGGNSDGLSASAGLDCLLGTPLRGTRPWAVGIEGGVEAVDNSLLASSERGEEEFTPRGELRVRSALRLRWTPARRARIQAGLGREIVDVEEVDGQYASRDRAETRLDAQAELRPWRGFSARAGGAVEWRDWDAYPARDALGQALVRHGVDAAGRDGLERDPHGGLIGEVARRELLYEGALRLRQAGGRWTTTLSWESERRLDRTAGYFDRTAHAPGASVDWRPTPVLEFGVSARRRWEFYDRYRAHYGAGQPLRRNRIDRLGVEARWSLASIVLTLGADWHEYRSSADETDGSDAATHRELQVAAGAGFSF